MAASRPKSGFFIGVTCPGCGGALELQSDFFVLACSHCGSNLRIMMPETPPAYLIQSRISRAEVQFHLDHYLKQNHLPLTGPSLEFKAVYYPYWKIDAIVLKLRNRIEERQVGYETQYDREITVQQKKTDINLVPFMATFAAGPASNEIPYSIGLRADYLKLIPFSQENIEEGFECIPVARPWGEVQTNLKKNIVGLSNVIQADFGLNKTELFHPVGAVVYFPYYILETALNVRRHCFVIDAVTGRVAADIAGEGAPSVAGPGGSSYVEFGKLSVEFHRCSNCGVDLPAKQSYIYICQNCQRLIALEPNAQFIPSITAAFNSNNQADRLFPFWSLRLPAESARRLKVMFGGIYLSDKLVIPAFRMPNFEAMYRLTKRISTALPKIAFSAVENFDTRFLPVALGPGEATALAEVIIYRESIGRDNEHAQKYSAFQPESISLFYAPFHPENYFYVDSILGAITFEKSLVAV